MAQKDEGGYWPGFVDALTNVVFVMIIVVVLLMLMFMATLLKVVHVERERMVAERVASEAVEKVEALKEASPTLPAQPPMPSSAPQAKPVAPAPAVAAVYVAPTNKIKPGNGEVNLEGALAFVVFPSRESTLDDKAIGELKNLLASKLDSMRANGVALRADAVPAYVSEGRRLGYYRIVAIREWLVNQGVPADKIDLRIADVPSVEGKQGVLMLARQPAAGVAAAQ